MTVANAAESIRLVHEATGSEQDAFVATQLRRAHRVCFLGFGYHEFAMRKLPLDELMGKAIYGTAFGLEEGERAPVLRRLKKYDPQARLYGHDLDVLGLLRHTEVIHGG